MRKVSFINSVGKLTYLAGGVQEGDKVVASQALLIFGQVNS
jgi:membrane fusion protein, heavy metal efflux system